MKKNTHILLLLLLGNLSLLAQAPDRFLQTYNLSPNYNSQSYGVANTSYGYIIGGISIDTIGNPNGYYAYTLAGVDINGNLLWEKKNKISNDDNVAVGWYIHDFIKQYDSFYYSTYNVNHLSTNIWSSYLIKYNESGDTIWTKEYLGDVQDSILETRSFNKTTDGGFIISGITYSFNSDLKLFVLKTDSLGNVEWKQKYDMTSEPEYVFNVIQDSITKKIVIIGYRNINMTSFVYILDSAGVLLQQKYFNSLNGGYLYNIKQLNDGKFVAVGTEYTGNIIGSWKMCKPMIIKFDINGNLIWKCLLGYESIENSFSTLVIEDNDTIIVAGYMDTLFVSSQGFNRMLCVQKITSSGNVVWDRLIDVFVNNGSAGVFQTIIKANNGGYATTGYDLNSNPPNPFILLKLDNWGCLSAGCQIVGVEELNSSNLFSVFPNPANNQIHIKFEQPNLLADTYEIIDLYGKVIMQGKITSLTTQINVEHLPSSLYLLQVKNKGVVVENKKISITH